MRREDEDVKDVKMEKTNTKQKVDEERGRKNKEGVTFVQLVIP